MKMIEVKRVFERLCRVCHSATREDFLQTKQILTDPFNGCSVVLFMFIVVCPVSLLRKTALFLWTTSYWERAGHLALHLI